MFIDCPSFSVSSIILLNNAFVDTPFVRSSPSLTYYVRATPNAIARYALLAAHYNYDNSPI